MVWDRTAVSVSGIAHAEGHPEAPICEVLRLRSKFWSRVRWSNLDVTVTCFAHKTVCDKQSTYEPCGLVFTAISVHSVHSRQQKNCCVAIVRSPRRDGFWIADGEQLEFPSTPSLRLPWNRPVTGSCVYALWVARVKRCRSWPNAWTAAWTLVIAPNSRGNCRKCSKPPIRLLRNMSWKSHRRESTGRFRCGDFQRFAGHEARVEIIHPIDGRRRFKGTIVGIHEGAIVVAVNGEHGTQRVSLPLSGIVEAKLVLTDRLIQESLKARNAMASKQAVPEQPDSDRRH